jgi:hypothetical protein
MKIVKNINETLILFEKGIIMNKYQEGREDGVYWYLDWKGDTMTIHVEKENNPEEKIEETYEFMYRPIFGFDVSDVANINEILDRNIKKLTS